MGAAAVDTRWHEDLTGNNLQRYTDNPDDEGSHLRQRRQGVAWSTSSDGAECSVRTGSTQPEDNINLDSFNDTESWYDASTFDDNRSLRNIPRTSSSVESLQSSQQRTYPEQEQRLLFPGKKSTESSLTARLNKGFTQTKETMSENVYVPNDLPQEQDYLLVNRELEDSYELPQRPTHGTRLQLDLPQAFSHSTLAPRKMSLPILRGPPLPLKPSQISTDHKLSTKAQSNQQLLLLARDINKETEQLQSETTEEGTPPLLPPKPKSSHLKPATKIKENHTILPPPRPPKPTQEINHVLSSEPTENTQQPLLPPKPALRNGRSPEQRDKHQNNQASGIGHQKYPKSRHNHKPNPPPRNNQQQIPAPRNDHQQNRAPRNDHRHNRALRIRHELQPKSVNNEQQNSPLQIIPPIHTARQLPIVQPPSETQISCSVFQHRHHATPTPPTSSEEVTVQSPSSGLHLLTSHDHTSTQRLRERRPHFLLNKRNLLIASSTSVLMSFAAISFLVCAQLNIFSFTWRDRTFKEGAYKTCVKCLSLIQDLSQDLPNPEFRNLITELRNGENFCCAMNSQQLSSLLKLILQQQQYKPSPMELSKPSVVPSAHISLLPSNFTSNIIGDGQTVMKMNQHQGVNQQQGVYQHHKGVNVTDFGLTIQTSGYYYVYSSICYDVSHSECLTDRFKHLGHTIFLVSPTNKDNSGILAKTATTCCTDCRLGDKQSSFAGGVFKLLENDQVATSVTNVKAAVKCGNSYLGVVMIGA